MNLVIIGAGPTGEAAAKIAAKKKVTAILIEKSFVGGVCLNWGCIPSKTLLAYGKKIRDLKYVINQSKTAVPLDSPSDRSALWKAMRKRKIQVVEALRSDDEKSIKLSGAKILKGEARFASKNTIELTHDGKTTTIPFDKAVIASGSSPIFPAPLDKHTKEILDSDRIFDMENLPESLVIVGGGAIGCEFACLFNELGVKVTMIEKTANLLPGEDDQVVNVLRKSFEARGIEIKDSCTIEKMERHQGSWRLNLSGGVKMEAAQILACVGRRPILDALQLDKAGVKSSPKGIEVNSHMQSSNSNVYAAGDVTGLSLLAHAGSAQGEIAAANALGDSKEYDGSFVPRCLYTWPEVASVGLGIHQAKEKQIETKSQRFFFAASGRALAEGDTEGFIQIILDKATEKILGAQIIGAHATELIHIISVALKAGMGKKDLKEVIFAHPTFAEGIKGALER